MYNHFLPADFSIIGLSFYSSCKSKYFLYIKDYDQMYVCVSCMHVCMCVCMYVCMCVCVYVWWMDG